jgi:hypothetical protein
LAAEVLANGQTAVESYIASRKKSHATLICTTLAILAYVPHTYVTCIWCDQPSDHAKQRRLSGAVATADPHRRRHREVEVNVVEDRARMLYPPLRHSR